MSDQQPVLEIENLSISFFVRAGEIPAVMDFSCKVMPGEAMGLVGESGCGKSTVALGIMRDLSNIGQITQGTIKFKGRDMGDMSDAELRDIRGSKISMIYQEPMASLNPSMKVGKQLMEVPIIHENVSQKEAYDRSLAMVESVRLPDPARMMDSYPHQLSGGQQQRIVIAMALLSNPDLLLLDEPTTALDVTVEAGIVELVKDLGEKFGTSLLFISHNLGLIRETCDRITVMYSGEAVESGSVDDVFNRMRHPYTQGLFRSIPLPGADKNERPLIAIPGQLPLPHQRPFGCNFGPRCHHFVDGVCNKREIPMMAIDGHDRHESRCERFSDVDWESLPDGVGGNDPIEPGREVLKIDSLKKYYQVAANEIFGGGEKRVVKANETISFTARESETVAIVGESGCGKSTLAKVLLGLETASDGTVTLDNREIQAIEVENRGADLVSSIQMVFQNPFDTLNPSHSVGSQIIRTLEKFDVGDTVEAREKRMFELLDLVKLPRAFAKRMPRQLSGGQKQRIGVARAFAGQPKVVVADEPVSALDVSVQAAVTELLMDIQRNAGTTMLFISHDLSVVRYIADRVVVMYLGHIVEQGSTEQIFAPPYHPYTEALLSAIPIADTSVDKKHIVLEGDIPSAMNPPSGCPFQTRCRFKDHVSGGLCEKEVPPIKRLADGHLVKCHLSDDEFAAMEPVISFDRPEKPAKAKSGASKAGKSGKTKAPAKETVSGSAAPVAALAAVGGAAAVTAKTTTKKAKTTAKKAAEDEVKASPSKGVARAKADGSKAAGDKVGKQSSKAAGAKSGSAKATTPKASTSKATAAKTSASPSSASKTPNKDANRPPKVRKPAKPDDLKMISGVGPKIEGILHGLGIYKFEQVAKWKKAEREWVDEHLRFKGRIEREDWVKQAKALAKGGAEEYIRVFGKKPR